MSYKTLFETGEYDLGNNIDICKIINQELIERIENQDGILISRNPPLWIIDSKQQEVSKIINLEKKSQNNKWEEIDNPGAYVQQYRSFWPSTYQNTSELESLRLLFDLTNYNKDTNSKSISLPSLKIKKIF